MESLPLLEVELELEFTAIYKRELRFVWENVRRLGVPARDLPDVTHDVFVAVFKNLWKYDGERPLRPWLFGVLFRVTSDHLRLARNQREVLDIAPDVVDGAPLPDTRAEAREKWRLVDEALASLDARRRAVLIMHDFEGHTGQEIARTLGVSLKTVFSRLYAARDHLLHVATRTNAAPPPRTLLVAVDRLRLSSAGSLTARLGHG